MKKTIVTLLMALLVVPLMAQENYYFPAKKGARLTYKFYNAKGKPLKDDFKNERWMTFTVDEVWPETNGAVMNVTVRNQSYDRFASVKSIARLMEDVSYGDVKVAGDSVTLDNVLTQGMMTPYPDHFTYMASDRNLARGNDDEDEEEGEVQSVELTALYTYPREMKVGDQLPDREVFNGRYITELSEKAKAERDEQMKEIDMELRMMGHGGMGHGGSMSEPAFYIKAKMKDRKVEAQEKVTTPAGTFDCYRISYKFVRDEGLEGMENFSMGMGGGMYAVVTMGGGPAPEPEGTKYVEWISPEVGLVKREKYNPRGKKVEETMVLEEYTK